MEPRGSAGGSGFRAEEAGPELAGVDERQRVTGPRRGAQRLGDDGLVPKEALATI